LAAGSTEPRRQSLGVLEHVVRDRNGGFHTSSITARRSRVNARGTAAFSRSQPKDSQLRRTSSRFCCKALLGIRFREQIVELDSESLFI
jgi:hypothetical protein